jgi:hypothetical protein
MTVLPLSSLAILMSIRVLVLAVWAILVSAAAADQTYFPGSVPLAVRSTYLNAYVPIGNQSLYSDTWPVVNTGLVRSTSLTAEFSLSL